MMNHFVLIRRIGIVLVLPLLAALLAVSCDDQDVVSPPLGQTREDSVAVTFRFDGMEGDEPKTRTTWDTNEFPNAAQVGIYVYDENGNAVYENAQYRYNSSTGTFTPYSKDQTIYTGSRKNYSYYAYSPYKISATAERIHANWSYTQTYTSNLKSADVLRAVNTSTGMGTSTIGLTFRHMLCRLDVDYSYYAGLGYTELVEQTLRLPAVLSVDMNLLTGALTYTATSTMTSWKGFSQDNARHLITTPYSFSAGDSLGYIRFRRPAGDTVKVSLKLVEDFKLLSGCKSVIRLSERTTVGTTAWAYSRINLGKSGSLDACATGYVTYSPTITETRTVQDYVGSTPVGSAYTQTRSFRPTAIRMTRYSGSMLFSINNVGGTATVRATGANNTTASRTVSLSMNYLDPEGNNKSVSTHSTLSQPCATRETIVGDPVLSSISVSSASVTACGVVTPGNCTATYSTTTSVVTSCGETVSESTASSRKMVTAAAPPIAENTSTSSKSVTITAYYTEGGIEKSATVTATQPGATITGGVTTWTSNAQAGCSTYTFPYTMSTATLSSVRPTYSTTAKVTECGTIVTPASSGTATVAWSVSAWSTSSTATKATISGSTLTVPANPGVQRTATVTATFSNGVSRSFTITQKASTHIVDVE